MEQFPPNQRNVSLSRKGHSHRGRNAKSPRRIGFDARSGLRPNSYGTEWQPWCAAKPETTEIQIFRLLPAVVREIRRNKSHFPEASHHRHESGRSRQCEVLLYFSYFACGHCEQAHREILRGNPKSRDWSFACADGLHYAHTF
jgi:hypothetical protein